MKRSQVREDAKEVARRFAGNFSKLRGVAELTMRQVAERTGINLTTLSMIESGQRAPRWEQVVALARLFKVSPGHFVRE